MAYPLLFPLNKHSIGSRLYKKLPKSVFQYDRFYCICNVGNVHWTAITVNFETKCIKQIDVMKAEGTQYISSIMYWLDYEHMRLHKK